MTTILIVDDALFMRQLIRQALEPVGYTIVGEAENGRLGVEAFRELRPDLVTMDIVMPELDGLGALEQIKAIDAGAQVVMITAVDQREAMLRAMKLGVADFIVKPFDEDRIVSAVEKAVSRHAGFRAREEG
jgi:two-component system chemotaxis response regulator CheY